MGYPTLASILWVLLGVYVALHGYHLGLGRLRHPGPGFIFFTAASLLILLGLIDLAGHFKAGKAKKETGAPVRWRKVLFVIVALGAYAFLLNSLGFLLATFLLMIFLFKAVEPMKWWLALAGSACTTLAAMGIFKLLLDVPFPRGPLGF